MQKYHQKVKPIKHLNLSDFQEYPIWTWYENDEDESLVMPINILHHLEKDEYGVLFILAELELRDGTKLMSNIAVNLTNRKVYALEFYRETQSFIFTGNKPLPLKSITQLSEWLQKPVEAITPIKYATPFSFEDGEAICGEIDLQDW